MQTAGSNTDDGAAGAPCAKPPARASRRLLRSVGRSTVKLFAAAAALLGLGFLWFIWRVPAAEIPLDRNADGIVALSGANRATNSNEISRLNPEFERWVRCCVDIDRSLNTLGNAVETKRWAESRGFRSLIVVTSNYHMPRALAELAHQLPDVALVPFPVVTDRQRAERWWAGGASARR